MVYGFLKGDCTEDVPYPRTFVFGYASFVVGYVVCVQFDIEQVKKCLKESDDIKERDQNELCLAQFEAFFSSYKLLLVWHGLEVFLGKVLFKILLVGALTCGGDGTEWHYRSSKGKLFLLLHILGVTVAL